MFSCNLIVYFCELIFKKPEVLSCLIHEKKERKNTKEEGSTVIRADCQEFHIWPILIMMMMMMCYRTSLSFYRTLTFIRSFLILPSLWNTCSGPDGPSTIKRNQNIHEERINKQKLFIVFNFFFRSFVFLLCFAIFIFCITITIYSRDLMIIV